MSADQLRWAATLMRGRASAASPGPWVENVLGSEGYDVRAPNPDRPIRRLRVARCGYEKWETDKANATHIASWHPAVALAVADWLDAMAARAESKLERGGIESAVWAHEIHALTVARAYLGESPDA